jgi:hypothetical protein
MVMIDGVQQPLDNRQTKLRDRYRTPGEGDMPKAYECGASLVAIASLALATDRLRRHAPRHVAPLRLRLVGRISARRASALYSLVSFVTWAG